MEEDLHSQWKPARRRSRKNPPPRPHGWREPSPTRPHGWLILDRIGHRSKRLQGVVERDATASATSYDCVGRPVRASLRVADPPAVSRLHLHLPDREEWIEDLVKGMEQPSVIAAHGNSILFNVVVPFKDCEWTDPFLFPIDYFVYSACPSSSPSLTRLPACFEGVAGDPNKDKYFHPYRRQRQRVMRDGETGLLCHGEIGDFTVAVLSPYSYREVELCFMHHAPPGAGTTTPWMVKRLQITPNMRAMGLNLVSFRTDVVLPIRDRLCWVDYYQGMLLVDFQPTDPDQQLSFIPLPDEALNSSRLYIDAGDPDPFRCVCVTRTGIVKFVWIIESRAQYASHLAFTIATWTLDISRAKWQRDSGATMYYGEFFGLYQAGQNLPRVMPSFPVVSMVEPNVINFRLKEEDDDIFWMIEVDMWQRKLLSSALYIKEGEEGEEEEQRVWQKKLLSSALYIKEGEEGEEEEEQGGAGEEGGAWEEGDQGYFSKKVCRNFFDGHYFISSQFSSYLSKDAITSRELSDMMQRKVMAKHKSGVEAPSQQFAGSKM